MPEPLAVGLNVPSLRMSGWILERLKNRGKILQFRDTNNLVLKFVQED